VRTLCGFGRRVQVAARRNVMATVTAPPALPASTVGRAPLLSGRLGEQRRGGARLDQVDGTTCGSAVLLALAAWADPAELGRLEGGGPGFGARFDARQLAVHRETNRLWPRALGTTPWAMARWLRRHVPAAGRYRVRLVDDVSATDVDDAVDAVDAALAAGRPVPLLVGAFVPRHYVMALGVVEGGARDGGWRVYEPTSGQVRPLDRDAARERRLAPVLGFDRLHAALLPA
jgi:hypothetical protein